MASNASEALGAPAPLIGLSTYVERARFGVWDETAALLPYSYVSAVCRAGGHPVLFPPAPSGPDAVLEAVDGLVITGGPDVDPVLYGAPAHAETDRPRQERDAWEISLCRAALEEDVPLLAICRGLQVLNVSLGGTLHQHLPDVVGHHLHRAKLGRTAPNRISFTGGRIVVAVLGPGTEGRCHHHQAVDRVGEGLEPVGFAPDGTIEAAEVAGKAFAVAVQWHPEEDPADDRLFRAFTEAAGRHRRARSSAGMVRSGVAFREGP